MKPLLILTRSSRRGPASACSRFPRLLRNYYLALRSITRRVDGRARGGCGIARARDRLLARGARYAKLCRARSRDRDGGLQSWCGSRPGAAGIQTQHGRHRLVAGGRCTRPWQFGASPVCWASQRLLPLENQKKTAATNSSDAPRRCRHPAYKMLAISTVCPVGFL